MKNRLLNALLSDLAEKRHHIQSLDPSRLGDIVNRNPELFAAAGARYLRGGGAYDTG
jgi:hypothetical protein